MTPAQFQARMRKLVERRQCSAGEASEAIAFFDSLAERELAGEISHEQAMVEVVRFGRQQMLRRHLS